MLSKTLQILANDLGLRVEENSACGIYEGYMISLYEAKGCKSVFFNCPFADPEDDALSNFDISESIKAKVETYAISDYGITGMGVYMTTRAPLADFKTMIDWAAQLLKENGIMQLLRRTNLGQKAQKGNRRYAALCLLRKLCVGHA